MHPRALAVSLASLLALTCSTPARAEIIEMKHDTLVEHSQAGIVCGFVEGEAIGVRFTPPSYPATLKSVKVLMANVPLDPLVSPTRPTRSPTTIAARPSSRAFIAVTTRSSSPSPTRQP